MVVENEIASLVGWLFGNEESFPAVAHFALVFGAMALAALVIGFLVLLVRYGPLKAGDLTYRTLAQGVNEVFRFSPGSVYALARVAVQESLRRRALVALVVFALVLVFAGWFLGTNHKDPARLYLSFVLTATTYLVLLLGLLLSAFSLPADFKSRVIYTVVTKPVRAVDIVLGRILGFTAVGTLLLVVMAGCSYLFVTRSLNHTHAVDVDSLENVVDPTGEVVGKTGRTTLDAFHRHSIEVGSDGRGIALSEFGHEHEVTTQGDRLVLGPPRGFLRARVPHRGKIRFLDRQGARADKGISVGSEWTYRTYIDGGTSAAAIWRFTGVTEETLLKEGDTAYLPVELIVRVFRSHKGDIERPIQGSIQLRNPETDLRSSVRVFPARDYLIDSFEFAREQFDTDQKPVDLLRDLVSEKGEIEVVVQCLERGQYYGFAQADCYIRRPDGSPGWNFVKGYIGIWVQMVVVITIGVMASTFLNGPIAALFTVAFLVLGFFRDFFIGIATGKEPDGELVYGGGPVEALVRLVTQMNLTTPFEQGPATSLMKGVDYLLQSVMYGLASVLPDFRSLSSVAYVSEGFDIPSPVVGRELVICLAYFVGLTVAGYFFLRTREVAR